MKKLALCTLGFFLLGFLAPYALAEDMGGFLNATKDKSIRGIENGVFGLGGELYHHMSIKGDLGTLHSFSRGLFNGLHDGIRRTVVGVYELATPFYHDEPLLSDLDTVVAS